MKTHELAAYMEMTAKILREMPDGELTETLQQIFKLVRKGKSKQSFEDQVIEENPPAQEMIDRLASAL